MSEMLVQTESVKADEFGAGERRWTPILASVAAKRSVAFGAVYSSEELRQLREYERLKSERNGEPNTMLVCHLNGSAGDPRFVRSIVKTIARTVRDTDHVGWLNDGEIGVLLSGTSRESASVLQRKLQNSFPSPSVEMRVEDL